MHIWERESGLLLHSLNSAKGSSDGDLTAIAWNQNCPGQYMLATGAHDGTVKIWTALGPLGRPAPSGEGSSAPMSGTVVPPEMGILVGSD